MWYCLHETEVNNIAIVLEQINFDKDTKEGLNKYIKTLYSISNNIEKNYKVYKLKKRNGKYRTIYEPNPLLKHIQRQILV